MKRSRPGRTPLAIIALLLAVAGVAAAAISGCVGPFDTDDYLALEPPTERLRTIDAVRFEDRSRTDPIGVDEAMEELRGRSPLDGRETPASIDLTIEEVRAASLENNLDLQVELINPSISAQSVGIEEAKFESAFSASVLRSRTDSATALETEGSGADFTSFDFGVNLPLRTGGTVNVNLPFTEFETNNIFATLNPSYTADLRFSISQPLLRGAGNRINTHSIRVVKHQSQITDARTKLETMRILANADRAYWRLYASQRALEVSQQQYELAMTQLEQARRRVRAGDLAQIEIIRAESGVAQRLEAIIIADAAVRRTRRDLKRIMARDDLPMESPTAITIKSQPDPVGLDLDPEELASFAVDNRMEMLELEIQLAIDASSIDFRRNAKLPLITLDYSYTINGLGASYNDAFDQIPDHSFEDWSVGLRTDIPIGNEAAKGALHQAVLQRVQRLATREQRRAVIRQEVYDFLDQFQQNWQRILAARQDALLAGRTYEAEKRQFEVGARTSTDVLDAAARLADAQLSEIRALTDYQIAQVDLAFATGTLLGYEKVRWEAIDVPFED